MNDWAFVGSIVVAAITVFGVWLTARSSDKANSATSQLGTLQTGIDTWKGLAAEYKEEREAMETRISRVEHDLETIRRELRETMDILDDSLAMNLEFIRWGRAGAEGPVPQARTQRLQLRLRELLDQPHNEGD